MLAESVENPSHQKRGKRLRNGLVGSVRPALVGWSGTLKEGWDGHLVAENRLFRGRYRQISVAIPMASRPTGQFPSTPLVPNPKGGSICPGEWCDYREYRAEVREDYDPAWSDSIEQAKWIFGLSARAQSGRMIAPAAQMMSLAFCRPEPQKKTFSDDR
jgi:hypothetical protein